MLSVCHTGFLLSQELTIYCLAKRDSALHPLAEEAVVRGAEIGEG